MSKSTRQPSPILSRPAPWALIALLVPCLFAAAAWLGLDSLQTFFLRGDDFVYLAHARTLPETLAHLFTPHNAHVVPLFRVWTAGLVAVAGSLAALPWFAMVASFGVFVSAVIGVGHLVAWESRRLGWGFAAMAGVALSSVLLPTVAWYSAGQALMAGSVVLAMLQAFQLWRWDGRRIWVVLGTLLALGAPWVWSGGYVGGLAGFVYLWLDGRPEARKLAIWPLVASLIIFGASVGIAGRSMFGGEASGGGPSGFKPIAGAAHTAQAIPEILVAANVGLDAPTTPIQGVALCAAFAVIWAWSRGWRIWPTPLEGAGAVLVLGGFGLAYTFRGSFSFESLRGISWYQAIPELGAFVFLGGWAIAVCGVDERPGPPRRFDLRFALALVGLMGFLLLVQSPRATRLFLEQVPPMAESERPNFPIPELQLLRGRYLASERVERQHRFLLRLDRADRLLAATSGASRAAIRQVIGRKLGTGMPEHVADLDAVSLLRVPESGGKSDLSRGVDSIRELLTPEPVVRPAWLGPKEIWAPKEW